MYIIYAITDEDDDKCLRLLSVYELHSINFAETKDHLYTSEIHVHEKLTQKDYLHIYVLYCP